MILVHVEVAKNTKIVVVKMHNMKNEEAKLNNDEKYFLISEKILPEIFIKVLGAKDMVENKEMSIQEATKIMGISRASYYKYASNIFPFSKNTKGKIMSLALSVKDHVGFLSEFAKVIAKHKCNILTIHQSVPVNKTTNISFSIEVFDDSNNVSEMVDELENMKNVKYCKVLAMEDK